MTATNCKKTNGMKYCDHHDPKIFKECVSAITLKDRPQRLLEEWLTEAEVIVNVTLTYAIATESRRHS